MEGDRERIAFPAFVSNDRTDLLVWSQALEELLGDASEFIKNMEYPLKMLALQFTKPEMQSCLVNWGEMAVHVVGIFRIVYDKHALGPWLAQAPDWTQAQAYDINSLLIVPYPLNTENTAGLRPSAVFF